MPERYLEIQTFNSNFLFKTISVQRDNGVFNLDMCHVLSCSTIIQIIKKTNVCRQEVATNYLDKKNVAGKSNDEKSLLYKLKLS